MTIGEQIYKRFITAICRLRGIEKVTPVLLASISEKFLPKKINSEVKLSIQVADQQFLIQLAIITALMEASDTWPQFEHLHEKHQIGAAKAITDNTTKQTEKQLTDFDKLLNGMLKVPPPDKKKNDKK